MFDDFELIDIFGAVVALLLLASVAVIILAAPEVSQRAEPPDSEWSMEMVNDSHMKISHGGGEPVDPGNLTIIVEEYPRQTEWLRNGSVSDGFLTEGSHAFIEVSEGQAVALYWSSSEDTINRNILVEGEA